MIDIMFWRQFVILIFGHAISDLALQHSEIGNRKSRIMRHTDPVLGIESHAWPAFLVGHGLINGALVYWCTGSVLLGIFESALHTVIDYFSSNRMIPFWFDQFLHVACKLAWCYIWWEYAPL